MKPLLVSLLLAAIPLVAADPLNGKWQIHQSIVGNESDMSCTFTRTGNDLAGTCAGDAGTLKLTGKVAENKVTWTINTEYSGSPLTLNYSGTMASAEKITGTVTVDPFAVDGEFTAVPAK